MKTAALTGGAGDGVYCIPIMRKLGIQRIYVKENFYGNGQGSLYTVLKPLYESQGFECLPTSGAFPGFNNFDPTLKFDVNLDQWRCRGERDRVHIIKNMMLHYRCFSSDWNTPFLNIEAPDYHPCKNMNLVFLTWRWREKSLVNWKNVVDRFGLQDHNTFFIGHIEDWTLFRTETGWHAPHFITSTLLDMATAIKSCYRLFCNQGVALTLAQGLGKEYYLERKPLKTNTLFYTKNEHILT